MEQMKSMGFQTPANIPYRVIGSPLYLEQKQIILYGLGQFAVGVIKVLDSFEFNINFFDFKYRTK